MQVPLKKRESARFQQVADAHKLPCALPDPSLLCGLLIFRTRVIKNSNPTLQ